jgi:hypothetical protein
LLERTMKSGASVQGRVVIATIILSSMAPLLIAGASIAT